MIIIRHRIRRIFSGAFQSLLLFISIAVSATLVFASLQVSGVMQQVEIAQSKNQVGNSDVIIEPNPDSNKTKRISAGPLDAYASEIQYCMPVFHCHVRYEPTPETAEYFAVWGADLEMLKDFSPIRFIGSPPEALGRYEIILSQKTADRLGYDIGDLIDLDVHAHPGKYRIAGVSDSEGIFADEAHVAVVVMNQSHLSEIFETDGDSNTLYVKLNTEANKPELMEAWRSLYNPSIITDSAQRAAESRNGSNASVTFLIVSCFALLVSAFIIYTSYRVIMSQSLCEIGTFRSVGATCSQMIAVLLLESAWVGLAGGAAGVLIGILASKRILSLNTTQSIRNAAAGMMIRPQTAVTVMIFALMLSLLGSLVPIISSSMRPLKEILLDAPSIPRKKSAASTLIGMALVVSSVALLPMLPKDMMPAIVGHSLCMTGILIGIIIVVPSIIRRMSVITTWIAQKFKWNALGLGALSIRDNTGITNNTILTGVGLASLIFIYILGNSLSTEMALLFEERARFDIYMVANNIDDVVIQSMRTQSEGIQVSPIYSTGSAVEKESSIAIGSLYGVDAESYFDMWDFQFLGDRSDAIQRMKNQRGIILASRLADRLKLRVGDSVTLDLDGNVGKYEVAGVFDTLWDSGEMALVSADSFRDDFEPVGYDVIFVRTPLSPTEVMNRMKGTYLSDIRYAATREEIAERSSAGIVEVFSVLKTFTQIALLISVIGVCNNLLLSLYERKKIFAIYRSVGADRSTIGQILLFEALISSLVAVAIGYIGATLLLIAAPGLMAVIVGPIDIHYSLGTYLGFGIAVPVLHMAATWIPAHKAQRDSLIDAVRSKE